MKETTGTLIYGKKKLKNLLHLSGRKIISLIFTQKKQKVIFEVRFALK